MRRLWPITLFIFVVLAWLLTLFIGHTLIDTWQERGQFGDLFGSVNALFAGLAFAGLIYAILLQRQELQLQREELRLQREEMAASREQLTAQAAAQVALFRATVGQVRVAGQQARFEAIKMSAQIATRKQRTDRANEIKGIAQTMMDSADALESDERGG